MDRNKLFGLFPIDRDTSKLDLDNEFWKHRMREWGRRLRLLDDGRVKSADPLIRRPPSDE